MSKMVIAELLEEFPGKMSVVAPVRSRDVLAQIPGARNKRLSASESIWLLPLTWAAAKQLRATFGDELEIGDALNEALWEMREHEERCAELRAACLVPAAPDFRLPEFDPANPKLLPYQETAVEWLTLRGSGLVGDEMGVGKTATGCMMARRWCEAAEEARPWGEGSPARALIVCPKTKRLDWLEELQMWWPEGHHVALNGTPVQRRKVIAAWVAEGRSGALVASWEDIKAHSKLASYGNEKLTEADKLPKEFNEIEWECVVADEAHRGLVPKSKQTRALWWLGDHARHRLALTGTPVANTVTDFWSMLRFAAPEEWGARTKFVERYVQLSYNFWGGSTVEGLKPETRAEFEELAHRWMVRRTKELVLPWLPKRKITRRWVEMPPKQRAAYKALAKDMVVDVDGGQLMAFSGLTLAARLSQLACSMVELNEQEEVRMVGPSPKVDALLELWEDADRKPMAVLSASRQLLDLTMSRLDKEQIPFVAVLGGMKSTAVQEAKRMFNSGEVDIILISLGAGAEGLSLTRGSLEVILDKSWSEPKNLQGNDRMHGVGRGDHDAEYLEIVEILTSDTVDEARVELLEKKGLQAEEVLRDKKLLKEVLSYGVR